MRPRIYVAGPYTQGDSCVNTRIALDVGNRLMDKGMAPFVPHLSHFWHTMTPRDYHDWLALDFAWVAVSDAVLRLPGPSSGADREVDLANVLKIPVVHDEKDLERLEVCKHSFECRICGHRRTDHVLKDQ